MSQVSTGHLFDWFNSCGLALKCSISSSSLEKIKLQSGHPMGVNFNAPSTICPGFKVGFFLDTLECFLVTCLINLISLLKPL
eukprot:05819.XXX_71029_71274_1 [CDS] Oithona nana genome sequencing.